MTQPEDQRRPAWGPDAGSAAALVVTLAVVWLVAKLVAIWGWVLVPGEYGDTYYYFLTAQETVASGGGVADALREYPTPAGLLLLWPYLGGADDHDSYRAAILAMTSVADAAFAALLGRRTGPVGVLAWVALTSALGQVALLRFDMLPAVVAGAAVLLAMQGRRTMASVLVGVGTGLKLWPIVLAPLVLTGRRWPRPLIALAGTGVGLVALSLATGGWDRLLSPLSYQGDRGLQIESVFATWPMHAWANDEAYTVWYSTFHAYEVTGPAVAAWLQVAQVASLLGVLGCVALLVWWFWRGADPAALGWLALVLVGTFVITSRALSPQYLLWLAAPTAVLVALARP
ncbi:MAG: glycosyltransferase family 87 protein, partial [Propionibacteriaceae bacterium]|nr:glycosyltransferase family 87 protein [Propionibacteriaceae bacterium]